MPDCEENKCIHRYYRFEVDKIDWTKAKFELLDPKVNPPTVVGTYTSVTVGEDPLKAGIAAAKQALKGREGDFFKEIGRKCPDGCRCPESKRPPQTDSRWTTTPDSQPYVTDFKHGTLTYRIHFVVPEFTADVVQRCKENEEKISWIPSEEQLLAIGPQVLTELVTGLAVMESESRRSRPKRGKPSPRTLARR